MAGWRFGVVLGAALLLSGCDNLSGKLRLIEGNFLFSRGMYNEAISAYLDAGRAETLSPYVNFALGSAYLVLEQADAALERFSLAENGLSLTDETRDLVYRIRYNSGVVRFEGGDYGAAADDFRRALEADSTQRDAKRNLELSIVSQFMEQQAVSAQKITSGTVAQEQNKGKSEIIFDFIRQKEVDRWKGWEWLGEKEESGPDY